MNVGPQEKALERGKSSRTHLQGRLLVAEEEFGLIQSDGQVLKPVLCHAVRLHVRPIRAVRVLRYQSRRQVPLLALHS